MEDIKELNVLLSDKLAKQSTSDSDTGYHRTIPSFDLNSPIINKGTQEKENFIYNIISNDLVIEKALYTISPEVEKEIINILNIFYFRNRNEAYLRQNNYLFLLNQSNTPITINGNIFDPLNQLNEENKNEMYIKFSNIQDNEIYINQIEFEGILKKKNKKISRIEIYDIRGNNNTINIYNYLARKFMSMHPNTLTQDNSFSTQTFDNINESHAIYFSSLPLPKNVMYQDPIELYDNNGEAFRIKKCFLKHLINKIFHGQSLPIVEKVCDIEGNIRTIDPDDINTYLTLIQISNLGDILFSEENRYFVAYDINSKKKFVNNKLITSNERCNTTCNNANDIIRLTSIASGGSLNSSYATTVSVFNKKELNRSWEHSATNNIKYIKLYDVQDNSYLIPEDQILKIYEQLVNRENLFFKQKICNDAGKEILFNINKMRPKSLQYYTKEAEVLPYQIINEESISFFEVTNCISGERILMKTSKIVSIIKNHIGKDFVCFDFERKMKICVEELKDILKVENKINEFIKVKNVSGKDCYIKKENLYCYLRKIISNSQVHDILSAKDNKNKTQYFDMKLLCKTLFSISPFQFDNNSILQLSTNTFIHSSQGFIKVNHFPQNELLEYMTIEDDHGEEFFIRKPFLRNLIYKYMNKNEKLPECIELYDLNHKKRKILLRKVLKQQIRTRTKFGNIKMVYNIKEVYVEVTLKDKVVLVMKSDLQNFIFENRTKNYMTARTNKKKLIKNLQGKIIEIDYKSAKNVNLSREWILIQDVNKDFSLIYKGVLKSVLCSELFEKKGTNYSPIVEVFDYYCKSKQIDSQKTAMNYMFQKSIIKESNRILIEVCNKTGAQLNTYR